MCRIKHIRMTLLTPPMLCLKMVLQSSDVPPVTEPTGPENPEEDDRMWSEYKYGCAKLEA